MGTVNLMKRRSTMIILAILAAVVLWYVWKRHQANTAQAQQQANGVSGGTNLNSIAPELVGGSTGPSIGPVLSTPIDITITSSAPAGSANPIGNIQPVQPGNPMIGPPQITPRPWGQNQPARFPAQRFPQDADVQSGVPNQATSTGS